MKHRYLFLVSFGLFSGLHLVIAEIGHACDSSDNKPFYLGCAFDEYPKVAEEIIKIDSKAYPARQAEYERDALLALNKKALDSYNRHAEKFDACIDKSSLPSDQWIDRLEKSIGAETVQKNASTIGKFILDESDRRIRSCLGTLVEEAFTAEYQFSRAAHSYFENLAHLIKTDRHLKGISTRSRNTVQKLYQMSKSFQKRVGTLYLPTIARELTAFEPNILLGSKVLKAINSELPNGVLNTPAFLADLEKKFKKELNAR